jgi:hypothetical protein
MEGKVEGFAHTFILVLVCLALYNLLVKDYVPTVVQNAIGI